MGSSRWRLTLPPLGSPKARRLDARAVGLIEGSGGLVMVAASPLVPERLLMALAGVGALLVGAFAWRTSEHAGAWRRHTYSALSMPVVVLGTAAAETGTPLRLGPVVLAVPLITLACVRPQREVYPQLAWLLLLYGVYVGLTLPVPIAIVAWMATAAAGCMMTVLLCLLRAAVEDLVDELRALAVHDPLTGLPNRLSLREWAPGRRGTTVAVLVVDVDHFKVINDTWGHDVGDQTLVRVANVLAGACRSGDLAVRLGGEEFALCLPVTHPQAVARAEAVREAVRRPCEGVPPVTVSVGVAMGDLDDLPALLRQADAALYQAKRQGRDRVVSAVDLARTASAPVPRLEGPDRTATITGR